MLELPHAMVGAAIAKLVPVPAVALPLALASHFLTDYVPHWNPHADSSGNFSSGSITIIAIDSLAALAVGLILAFNSSHPWLILFACLLAVLPDVVEIPHFFLNLKLAPIEKLLKWQKAHQWNVPMFWGLLSQTLVILLCFYFMRSA